MAEVRGDQAVKHNLVVSGNATFEKGALIPYLEIVDRKTKDSGGGTFTQGSWRTRDLTDVNFNEIGASVTLAAHAGDGGSIQLTKGVYYCEIECPAFNVNEHCARLADTTDHPGDLADVLIIGTSEFAADTSQWYTSEGAPFSETIVNAATSQTRSKIAGRFQLTATRTLKIQHRCSVTQSIDGFGSAGGFYQTDNIFTTVKMWRVRDDTI